MKSKRPIARCSLTAMPPRIHRRGDMQIHNDLTPAQRVRTTDALDAVAASLNARHRRTRPGTSISSHWRTGAATSKPFASGCETTR